MKKLAVIILAMLLMFSVSACTSQQAPAASGEQLTLEAGKLLVSISPDFAPMEFVDTSKSGQDQYVGFDVTLAKFIADEMGLQLEIMPMSFDACQVAVQTKTVDMSISGYSYTEERAANFNLSDYYYAGDNETEQTIIVSKENAGKWTTAADYSGKTVAAQTASLQMNLCNEQLPEGATIKEFSDLGTAVEALRNGNIDALAVAKGNGKAIIANNDSLAFTGFEFQVDEAAENNVILLKKGNDALTKQVNEILAKALAAGLYGPWYEEAEKLAGIETAAEVGYDDQGNVAG
jgi:polar amino acid transport system substrate-binding protein